MITVELVLETSRILVFIRQIKMEQDLKQQEVLLQEMETIKAFALL